MYCQLALSRADCWWFLRFCAFVEEDECGVVDGGRIGSMGRGVLYLEVRGFLVLFCLGFGG